MSEVNTTALDKTSHLDDGVNTMNKATSSHGKSSKTKAVSFRLSLDDYARALKSLEDWRNGHMSIGEHARSIYLRDLYKHEKHTQCAGKIVGRECHCLRCEYTWFSRKTGRVKGCARCGSDLWDKPRQSEVRQRVNY